MYVEAIISPIKVLYVSKSIEINIYHETTWLLFVLALEAAGVAAVLDDDDAGIYILSITFTTFK